MEIPEHLKGVFKRFETHAGTLRSIHGAIKRAIRFDDQTQGLCMDVKLPSTSWHRITQEDINQVVRRSIEVANINSGNSDDRKKILMLDGNNQSYHVVGGEEDEMRSQQ